MAINQRGDHHLAPEMLINQTDTRQLNKDAAKVFVLHDSAEMERLTQAGKEKMCVSIKMCNHSLDVWHNVYACSACLNTEHIHCLFPVDNNSHQMDMQLWEAEVLNMMFNYKDGETQRPLHGPAD